MMKQMLALMNTIFIFLLDHTLFRKISFLNVEINLRARATVGEWIKCCGYAVIHPDKMRTWALEIPVNLRGKQIVSLICFQRQLPPHWAVWYLRCKGYEPGVLDHLLAVEALARPSKECILIAAGTEYSTFFGDKAISSCPKVFLGGSGRTLALADMNQRVLSAAYFIAIPGAGVMQTACASPDHSASDVTLVVDPIR